SSSSIASSKEAGKAALAAEAAAEEAAAEVLGISTHSKFQPGILEQTGDAQVNQGRGNVSGFRAELVNSANLLAFWPQNLA
ncbi:hypothetical protein, partial [Salmonella enterica]|uniref:hypothetical protein n=1 Tax=Salmonella enterica TaxID=28901 RepID=UPI003CE8C044